jgi:hypothetical protein
LNFSWKKCCLFSITSLFFKVSASNSKYNYVPYYILKHVWEDSILFQELCPPWTFFSRQFFSSFFKGHNNMTRFINLVSIFPERKKLLNFDIDIH